MKNAIKGTLVGLSIALALSFSSVASAAETCTSTDHPVYASDDATVIGCISDAAWQAAVDAQTARADQHLPVVQSGTILKDAAGISFQVPNIIYLPGWVDLTHTAAYEAQARQIAFQLHGGYGYEYWLTN